MKPCDDCGRVPDPRPIAITVQMEPGPDGEPWTRCAWCQLQGLRTRKEPET